MRRENPSKQRLVLGQYRGLVSVISGPAVGGHLESRNALEVHHLQHLLGLGVNLDDVLQERIIRICSPRYFSGVSKPLNISTIKR